MDGPRRRRWLRLGLRGLMVVVAAAGIGLGFWVDQAGRQRRAERLLEAQGVGAVYEHQMLGMKDLPGPAWLRRLIGDEAFTRIRKVALIGTTGGIGLRPEELDALADLPGLQSLSLIGMPLDDRHMERIGRMTDLVELDLSGTSITDEDLAPLAGLDELEEFDLSDTSIRGPGLRHLARLPRLRYLQLHGTGVSDADLPRLMTLPRLEGLSVGERVTDVGAATLGRLKGLNEIDFVNSPVTVQGIAPILKLSGLRSLGLFYTRIFGDEIGRIEAQYPRLRVEATY